MTQTAVELLRTFEALPIDDQQELLAELLRRAPVGGPIDESDLDAMTDELFAMYDAEEAADGQP